MGISYKKLWVKLAEMEMDKVSFRKRIGFSPNTMTKLNKNDEVSLSIILKICAFLKCNIGDICDAVIIEEGEEL
ncbi:MAG: helix-turn-helix transcriptional regulator [Mobilitalea sp.]